MVTCVVFSEMLLDKEEVVVFLLSYLCVSELC